MAAKGWGAEGTEQKALAALGAGFDLACDFRLRFCKSGRAEGGAEGEAVRPRRLVELDEQHTRDVAIPGGSVVRGVPRDIGCDKGDRIRFRSDVLEFNKMSELLNQKCCIHGKVPSGYFNALFDLSGSWLEDAMQTKHLAFDGYFISLYNLHLTASPLVLRDEVKRAVPPKWDPVALSRFIKTYGTHIIVGMAIGGQDVVCVRQTHSSPVSPADLKVHLEDLGDFFFSDGKSLSPLHRRTREGKNKVPDVFNKILQPSTLPLPNRSETSSKDGLTVICSKRGGGTYSSSHSEWLQRVSLEPEAVFFKFVPITSLLTGIPGSGYLSHAINLYLRYKPPSEDLQYFLEFQVPLQWVPMFNELTLGPQRRKASYPSLQFRFLGPKLQVNTAQVSAGVKPVTGLRLYLEGNKCNRLAIHVQHLSSLPSMLQRLDANLSKGMAQSIWQGSEDSGSAYLEHIQWKRYSHICSSPVKYNPNWLQSAPDGVFIVTGAQLVTKGNWPKKSLHLRLLFTRFPNCTIQKTQWDCNPVAQHKSSFLTNLSTTFTREAHPPKQEPVLMNSGVFPDGPPVPVQSRKLLKYVDMAEVVRGPHDAPGHWLVIAAKLVKDGGKIGLQAKFALLNYPTKEK